jgi:hypothetical protein
VHVTRVGARYLPKCRVRADMWLGLHIVKTWGWNGMVGGMGSVFAGLRLIYEDSYRLSVIW